jgi:hypothetical protein
MALWVLCGKQEQFTHPAGPPLFPTVLSEDHVVHPLFVVLYTHTISQSLKEQVNRKPETG